MTTPDGDTLALELYDKFKEFHLTTLAPDRIRVLVTVARLPSVAAYVAWGDPLGNYCNELLRGLVAGGRVVLLQYLAALKNPAALKLGQAEREWIDNTSATITTLSKAEWDRAFLAGSFDRALNATVAPAATAAEAALARHRASDDLCGTGQPYPKLDHERLLIDCDMRDPCDALAHQLGGTPAAGIYSFATAGDQALLQNFVLPRLQRHLRQVMDRDTAGHFFWAVPGSERVVLQADRPLARGPAIPWRDQFRSFASDQDANHTVVVWNDNRLPAEDVAAFAASLEDELYPSLLPLVQQNDQLFIVLWADVVHATVTPQPCYTCLPLPQQLVPDEIKTHFNRYLRQKVDDQDRGCAVDAVDYCLQVTGGYPKAAFPRMEQIVDRLKEGTI